MKVTLHQFKVLAAVAEAGSVTQAAHDMHMTQPAVSNIIRQLEDFYQCRLFDLVGRKISLTQFGEVLVETAKSLHATLSNTQAKIDLLRGGLTGTLSVATVTTARYFVPKLLGSFKQEHPNIHFKLTTCNRQDILARLKKNLDDFVIMSHPPTMKSVDCVEFYDDELVVVAPNTFPLKKSQFKLADLADQPWIVREEGSGTRYAAENIFHKLKFAPKVEMEIGDIEAIKQAIMAGMGISVVSKHSIEAELANQQLIELPVKGFPVKHIWYLVKNKGKTLSPVAKNFYVFVHK